MKPIIVPQFLSYFQISIERAVEIDARRNNIDATFNRDVYRQSVLTEKVSSSPLLRSNDTDDDFNLRELEDVSGKVV